MSSFNSYKIPDLQINILKKEAQENDLETVNTVNLENDLGLIKLSLKMISN